MGIFKKKNKEITNEFREPQYIDQGNLYDNYMLTKAQKEIDLNNVNNDFDFEINNQIDSQTLDVYYIFEKQIDYFISTINYKVDDPLINSNIKIMLRCAIKNGSAGLYYMNNKFIPCGISKIEYDIFNQPKSAVITPLNSMSIAYKSEKEYEKLATLDVDNIENLIIFKWGSSGISGWITLWKMCLVQNELMTMINVDKYSYIKKFIYKRNNPKSNTANEIKDYFNPKKVYISVPKGIDISNRLEINESAKVIQPNILVEYYKQVMGIWYSLFGRRTNNDFKKERSVTQEIGLTNDNYTILEKDWIDEFKIFSSNMKNKFNVVIEVNDHPLRFEGVNINENVGDDNDV